MSPHYNPETGYISTEPASAPAQPARETFTREQVIRIIAARLGENQHPGKTFDQLQDYEQQQWLRAARRGFDELSERICGEE